MLMLMDTASLRDMVPNRPVTLIRSAGQIRHLPVVGTVDTQHIMKNNPNTYLVIAYLNQLFPWKNKIITPHQACGNVQVEGWDSIWMETESSSSLSQDDGVRISSAHLQRRCTVLGC